MRDLALLSGFILMLVMGRVFVYPHIGLLIWAWTAMVVPNNYAWGFAGAVRYNLLIAVMTIGLWLVSKEPKKLSNNPISYLLILYLVWGFISAIFTIATPEITYPELDKFAKIIVFSLVVSVLINSKHRVDALLYATVLSLGYHGIVSGAKFLASLGASHIYGPGRSILSDNNHFALAMIALLPIIGYLYQQATNKIFRLILLGAIVLVTFTIMGTFSRGGLLGILAVSLLIFIRSQKKVRFILAMIPLVVAALMFAPERWFTRMDTIAEANQDSSFMGRVIAWKQSTLIAIDHPVFGGGFHAVQDFSVWKRYALDFDNLSFIPTDYPDPYASHAAHSIYFQVLGDMGFFGLGLFISLLLFSWRNAAYIRQKAKGIDQLAWAGNLATAIQYSMFAYMVAGAALSMAYFDFMYMIFGLLAALRKIVNDEIDSVAARPVRI